MPTQVCRRPRVRPTTSTAASPTRQSGWGVTSRSPRSATLLRGEHLRPSPTLTGATLAGCTVRRPAACDYAVGLAQWDLYDHPQGQDQRRQAQPTRGPGAARPCEGPARARPRRRRRARLGGQLHRHQRPRPPRRLGLEAWFGNRTAIEGRFRELKHGGGPNHLPSADPGGNSVWVWAGLAHPPRPRPDPATTTPAHHAAHRTGPTTGPGRTT